MVFQTCQPGGGFGRIAAILRAGHRHVARGHFIDDLAQPLRRQILVIILADLRHGRIGAGPEAFDLFPAELAIGGKLMRPRRDTFLADAD